MNLRHIGPRRSTLPCFDPLCFLPHIYPQILSLVLSTSFQHQLISRPHSQANPLRFPRFILPQSHKDGSILASFITMAPAKFAVALHAGTSDTWNNDAVHQQEVEKILKTIAETAGAKLSSDAKAIDVVQAVVTSLEDCPLFNAGKGAVLNEDSEHEVPPDSSVSCCPSSHSSH